MGSGYITSQCCGSTEIELRINPFYWQTMVISERLIINVIFFQSGKATASEYSFFRMSIKVFRLSR